MEHEQWYDVVVVGGGAAGLSGALALGRSRRSVLVLDAGDPRNTSAGHVHNCLRREGMPPLELPDTGRYEVAQYGVEVASCRVTHVRPWTRSGTGFVISTDDGREVLARQLSSDVALVLTEGCPRPTEDDLEQLAVLGVRVMTDPRAELADLFEQPGWEDRYAARDAVWSGRVNPQLAIEAADLAPGRALDVDSGEGADPINWP